MDQVERAASALRAAGVDPGDRVLVTARNTAEYLLVWLALMEVGAVQVPVNPKSSRDELAGFVQQAAPRLVVTDSDLASLVDEAVGEAEVSVERADVVQLFTAAQDGRGPANVDEHDLAVMIPTSGTTGRSKLVMQTHLAYVMAGEGFPYWLQLTSDDRLMTSLPLFHINAPAYSTLGSVAARGSLVLLPGFSARDFIAAARRYEATEFNAIGAMLEILMRQPERPDDADNLVRLCYTGPSPAEVEAALERHPDVAEAAVIAVPSELSEDDVKAFMTATPGGTLDVADVHAFAGRHLARFKVPRYFEVVDELPHTPTGRLAKHRLTFERTPEEVDIG